MEGLKMARSRARLMSSGVPWNERMGSLVPSPTRKVRVGGMEPRERRPPVVLSVRVGRVESAKALPWR